MSVSSSAINSNEVQKSASHPQDLTEFLREELGISEASIELAMRHCSHEQGTLPMMLWRYGLVSIEQLNQIFDWLAQ